MKYGNYMKMKIAIRVIIIFFIMWLIIGLIDFCCVHSFEKPVFSIGKELAQDGGSGHYQGLGYSFDIKGNFMPEDEFPGVTKYTYYIFGKEISSEVRD